MSGRPSAATERALARIQAGATAYSAAKAEGIALSTIYRALKAIRARQGAAAARQVIGLAETSRMRRGLAETSRHCLLSIRLNTRRSA